MSARSLLAFSLIAALVPANLRAADDSVDDLLLFPEYRLEYQPSDGVFTRTWRRTANESISLLNETASDAWNVTKSPLDWRWREWLVFAGVAGGATALVYLGDEDLRRHAQNDRRFQRFGNKIRFLSDGTAYAAVTGSFLLWGALLRDKEIDTATMLMESSAIGFGYSAGLKRVIGRRRPSQRGARDFRPFSGNFSMPSGETTHAFAMASIVAEQYRNWPVRIASYGLASSVAAGRIARDGHWTSDVFAAAAIGTFVGRSVAWLHHERDRMADERKRLGLAPPPLRPRHSFHLGTRSIGWNVRY